MWEKVKIKHPALIQFEVSVKQTIPRRGFYIPVWRLGESARLKENIREKLVHIESLIPWGWTTVHRDKKGFQ